VRYCHAPITLAKWKRFYLPTVGKNVEEKELMYCWWECRCGKHFGYYFKLNVSRA
jgi:hypothetical protein